MATKFTVTNEKAVGEASKKIADNGLEKAHDEFIGFVQSGNMPKSKDIALGYRLMQEYQKGRELQEGSGTGYRCIGITIRNRTVIASGADY